MFNTEKANRNGVAYVKDRLVIWSFSNNVM